MASTVLIASLLTANKLKLCLTAQLLPLPTFWGPSVGRTVWLMGSYGRDQITWLATKTSPQTALNGSWPGANECCGYCSIKGGVYLC